MYATYIVYRTTAATSAAAPLLMLIFTQNDTTIHTRVSIAHLERGAHMWSVHERVRASCVAREQM